MCHQYYVYNYLNVRTEISAVSSHSGLIIKVVMIVNIDPG